MKAKPFVKWVGGKTQLIEQLDTLLPNDFAKWENVTYIEPFVGGGAMLFYMLQKYQNITSAVVNDCNRDLMSCYKVVKFTPDILVQALSEIQKEYYGLKSESARKEFFLQMRGEYNSNKADEIRKTTLFFFLNRTCFNGLYRVNKSGLFNVPFGKYEKPIICDTNTIYADSEILQKVEIMVGDFELTYSRAKNHTLFYFDPPYRPLSNTSCFNDYTKESFEDDSQIRLKEFCDKVHQAGFYFMLSNSDCKEKNVSDTFFDDLYRNYQIDRVWASRSINANPKKRGKLTEILVHNYEKKNIKAYCENQPRKRSCVAENTSFYKKYNTNDNA